MELESSREPSQDAKLYHLTTNMRSPSATSTVIYAPESSNEPWIKKVNAPSDYRRIIPSLPTNSQDYRNNIANWTISDHRNDAGERRKVQKSNGSDMPRIKMDIHPSSIVRDYQEPSHRLEGQNRQRKVDHGSLKFESINSNEYLQSLHSFKEHQANTGYEVADLSDGNMKFMNGDDNTAQEEKIGGEENSQSARSLGVQSPHGSESIPHTEATKASTYRADYHANDWRRYSTDFPAPVTPTRKTFKFKSPKQTKIRI